MNNGLLINNFSSLAIFLCFLTWIQPLCVFGTQKYSYAPINNTGMLSLQKLQNFIIRD